MSSLDRKAGTDPGIGTALRPSDSPPRQPCRSLSSLRVLNRHADVIVLPEVELPSGGRRRTRPSSAMPAGLAPLEGKRFRSFEPERHAHFPVHRDGGADAAPGLLTIPGTGGHHGGVEMAVGH